MSSDLLQSLEILSQFVLKLIGQYLGVLAIPMVLLSVEEPIGDLVLPWVLHYGHHTLNLYRVE